MNKEDIGVIRGMIKKSNPSKRENPEQKNQTVDAKIVDVKVRKISEMWRRKPRGLSFEDTDAIIVTAKTSNGKIIRDTFYTCIKPDGTFNIEAVNNASRARRMKLANFLRHYGITQKVEDYNIVQQTDKWKGKNVEVVLFKDGGYILIP